MANLQDTYVLGGALFLPPGSPAIPAVRAALRYPNPEFANYMRLRDRGRLIPKPPTHIYCCREIPEPHPWAGGLAAPRYLDLEAYDVGLPNCVDRTTQPWTSTVKIAPGFKPRDYQTKAVDSLMMLRSGYVVAPCGSGKSAIGVCAIARIPSKALVLVHTKDLARQWVENVETKLVDEAGNPVKATIWGDNKQDDSGRVVVGLFQSLVQMEWMKRLEWGKQFGLTIADECFPAGTPITMASGKTTKAIESIKAGDRVLTFDKKTGELRPGNVVRTFRNPAPSSIVKIAFGSGAIYATEGHPFLTNRGWVKAADLQSGDMVLSADGQGSRYGQEGTRTEGALDAVQLVRRGGQGRGPQSSREGQAATPLRLKARGEGWSRLLFRRAHEALHEEEYLGSNVENESGLCVKTHERKQPDARSGGQEKAIRDSQAYGPQATGSGRQREATTESASGVVQGPGLAHGSDSSNRNQKEGQPQEVAATLQDRHCGLGDNDCHRGRRGEPHVACGSSQGREKREVFVWRRVDRVEVQEQGGPGGSRQMCPDGHVYNFEVEGTHTYVANGLVVHNCHHVPARTYEEVMLSLSGRYRLGLTATPKREDGLTDLIYFHIGTKILEVDLNELERRGLVVLPRIQRLNTGWYSDDDGDSSWNDVVNAMTADRKRNKKILTEVVSAVRSGRQVLILSPRVDHCEKLAEWCRNLNIKAEALVGKCSKTRRIEILEKADKRELQVVTATQLADEGLDLPGLDTVVLAVPTKAMGRIQQRIGRIMRPAPNKLTPIVIDCVDDGGAFEGLWKKRLNLYKKLGCKL